MLLVKNPVLNLLITPKHSKHHQRRLEGGATPEPTSGIVEMSRTWVISTPISNASQMVHAGEKPSIEFTNHPQSPSGTIKGNCEGLLLQNLLLNSLAQKP